MIRLFVGGLNYETDELKLKRWFEGTNGQPGYAVHDVRVMRDRETQKHRGFGFVTLDTEENVEAVAARYHDQELDGRAVTVRPAHPKQTGDTKRERTY